MDQRKRGGAGQQARIRRSEIKRRWHDMSLIRKYMPHACPDTQRRAQATLASLESELAALGAQKVGREEAL